MGRDVDEDKAVEGDSMAWPRVVGIGCAVIDYLGVVPRMPRFDDAQAVEVREWSMSGGGPVATALVTAARLGVSAGYIGVLGDDPVGRQIREEFVHGGVDVSHLRHDSSLRSPTAVVLVEEGTGRRAFIGFRDAPGAFPLTIEDRRAIAEAQILHLDGWYSDTGITAARLARAAGVTVSLDAYRIDDRTPEWISVADVLIATESFPQRYTGQADLVKASELLLDEGPRVVVTTLSESGCMVVTREAQFLVPGYAVKVVDTTGAGDAFHGAFLSGMSRGWDLARTAAFANAVGAMACRGLGGRASLPTLVEVDEFLSTHSD